MIEQAEADTDERGGDNTIELLSLVNEMAEIEGARVGIRAS